MHCVWNRGLAAGAQQPRRGGVTTSARALVPATREEAMDAGLFGKTDVDEKYENRVSTARQRQAQSREGGACADQAKAET